MSTIDINSQNVVGDCNLKCAYSFDYQDSSVVVTNNGFSVSLMYDKANVSPVIYNANKYEVSSVVIYAPSIHTFKGNKTNAEIVIYHVAAVTGQPLAVALPIIASSNSMSSTTTLSQIIAATTANAPAKNESATINISGFNLNNVVPGKTPFYSYTSSDSTNWIVFGLDHGLSLDEKTCNNLKRIITSPPSNILPSSGPNLFYNSIGSMYGFGGPSGKDQIYIDCQPVTSSENVTEVTNFKPSVSMDLMKNSTFVLILSIVIGCLLFIILFFAIYNGLRYLSRPRAPVILPKTFKNS
jgi:carbonic anhydrase